MMSLTFGLFTQVSGSGPLGPLVLNSFYVSEGTLGGILKSHPPSLSRSIRYKLCLRDNLKTTEAN